MLPVAVGDGQRAGDFACIGVVLIQPIVIRAVKRIFLPAVGGQESVGILDAGVGGRRDVFEDEIEPDGSIEAVAQRGSAALEKFFIVAGTKKVTVKPSA